MATTRTPRQAAGALIRSYRERAGLTLAQLAERAGLSRRTLQRYEAGDYALGTDDVLPLALALDLDDEGRGPSRSVSAASRGLWRAVQQEHEHRERHGQQEQEQEREACAGRHGSRVPHAGQVDAVARWLIARSGPLPRWLVVYLVLGAGRWPCRSWRLARSPGGRCTCL